MIPFHGLMILGRGGVICVSLLPNYITLGFGCGYKSHSITSPLAITAHSTPSVAASKALREVCLSKMFANMFGNISVDMYISHFPEMGTRHCVALPYFNYACEAS